MEPAGGSNNFHAKLRKNNFFLSNVYKASKKTRRTICFKGSKQIYLLKMKQIQPDKEETSTSANFKMHT